MPQRDVAAQHTRPTARDELAAAKRDHLLKESCSQRRTHTGMEHRQPPSIYIYLVDRMPPNLAAQMLDDLRGVLLLQPAEHILKEACHGVLRHVARLDDPLRLDDCLKCRVKLQDGILAPDCLVVRHTCSPNTHSRGRDA